MPWTQCLELNAYLGTWAGNVANLENQCTVNWCLSSHVTEDQGCFSQNLNTRGVPRFIHSYNLVVNPDNPLRMSRHGVCTPCSSFPVGLTEEWTLPGQASPDHLD